MRTLDQILPRPGWALCVALKPVSTTASGLLLPPEMGASKVSECVATVHSVSPAIADDGVTQIDPGIVPGDRVLIRDFLKYANPVGDLVGADTNDRAFLLSTRDVLAVVSGAGRLGFYGEYALE